MKKLFVQLALWGSALGLAQAQFNLPVTFDAAGVTYTLSDFGGNSSSVGADPANAANQVGISIKTASAETWAGTTIGTPSGFNDPIPFAAGNTQLTMRVYAPAAGMPIRLKAEDATNGAISVETEATTTVANAWETLTFDFSNQAAGTAAINFSNTYKKLSVFFNFGTSGATAGALTFYWDDVMMAGGALLPINLPITFDAATVDYTLTDFGGNSTVLGADPGNAANTVAISTKGNTAESWAGTTMGTAAGFPTAIPLNANQTKISMRVYAPAAGMPIRLKAEDATNAAISVETEASTTVANAWETLTFDFINNVAGTAAIDFNNTYEKLSVFFNFGTPGATSGALTFYWDDVQVVVPVLTQLDLPVTFDVSGVNYALTDFGGNSSALGADPDNASNTVAVTTRTTGAQTWAGTTIGTPAGFATAIPLATNNKMTMRLYSPASGLTVRLKAEVANDPTKSVETDAQTTVANAWETLTFDFSNQAAGTAALDPTFVYQKLSVFFNFGVAGSAAGEQLFYWDDVMMASGTAIDASGTPAFQYSFDAASGLLNLRSDAPMNEATVYNLAGQRIAAAEGVSTTLQLSLAGAPAGVYVVRCVVDGVAAAVKIAK